MSKVEVVVAAMNQHDLSLLEKMNINTDIVIANQADGYSYLETTVSGNTVKMITTKTRGVGLNRNLGLMLADDEIIMLADEDIIFHDNYSTTIERAFEELPEADVIIFQMRFLKDGKVYEIDNHKTRRLNIFNGLKFGTYQIAIKKCAL